MLPPNDDDYFDMEADEMGNPYEEVSAPIEKTADQRWQEQIAEADESLKETHVKKEYTLSIPEKSELIKVVGINAFAKQVETLSQQLADNLLNLNILPRVGVVPSQDKRVLYDPEIGRFMVWSPKTKKD